jgi:hypothetical protein
MQANVHLKARRLDLPAALGRALAPLVEAAMGWLRPWTFPARPNPRRAWTVPFAAGLAAGGVLF